jgi:hypothetical protein
MQFKVPQDVQRKDTIIWSLTIQQLVICFVGGGIAYAIYIQLSKAYFMEVWLPPVVIISAITLAFAFLTIHNLPFDEFLMHFIEYHMLPRKRFWIQGAGAPFIPPFDESKRKAKKAQPLKDLKKKKSLEELTQVLDAGGSQELSADEKKKGLKNLIKQNYNN